MAAIASVSFTTVSSATLAAGTFAFFAGQAGAEDLTHDPILTQQQDHAKKIEFGKLSLSETGAEQVENNVAKSSFGSGDVAHLAAAATLGGDIVDAVLCEGYSEAGGSWQADAAALSSTLDPAATSEFVTAEGLATVDSGEPVFSTTAAAAPAAATSALDLAPQQDNSYYGTTATSTTASSGSAVSAPSVGGGAGAGAVGGASGSTGSITRPVVMKTAGVRLQSESSGETSVGTATQDTASAPAQNLSGDDELVSNVQQPRTVTGSDMVEYTPSGNTDLGKFLFMGDSITHGVVDQTYRWQMFKGFVDNGITFDFNGPRKDYASTPTNMNDAGSAYGGVTFENVHYAESSGRAYEMISGKSHYVGWPVSKVGQTDYDTYTLMIATNDILSDTGLASGVSYSTYADKFDNLLGGTVTYTGADKSLDAQWTWTKGDSMSGHLNTILNALNLGEGDTFYVISVPDWASGHGNHNNASDHAAVTGYNTMLQQWVAEYNKTTAATVKYVDINVGLTDVTVSATQGAVAPFDFFSNNDRLHPSQQGSIIMGANLTRAMGLAGRTAGLHRADTTGWTAAQSSSITLTTGQSQEIARNIFIEDQGYTIDFHANFGDGANNDWLDAGIHTGNMSASAQNVLAITIGDGINGGTLNLSEGYIMWGSNILYCQDNSQNSNDAIRIAYHNGSTADNVAQGYYVWLGDMLIGQGLSSTPGLGWNGIRVSSTGGTATLTGLMYTDAAYAPETDFAIGSSPYYVTQDRGQTVLVETREAAPNHHADPISSGVAWATATKVSYAGSKTARYAQDGTGSADQMKAVSMNLTSTGQTSWIGAKGNSGDYTGDVAMELVAGSYGCNTVFGIVNGSTLEGNVTVELNSANATINSFTGTNAASLIGGYKGSITKTFKGVVNAGVLNNDIIGGFHTADDGNHIGAVDLIVNGGTMNGNVYGGSVADNGKIDGNISIRITDGTINGSVIGTGTAGTINGKQINITLSGGVITGDVLGRANGFNYSGTTNVTVSSYLPLIKGNITADNVTLSGVEDTQYAGYMDTYRGTVTGTSTITLNDYTAKDVMAKLVTQDFVVSGTTVTTVHNLTLTACSITAGADTELTLADSLTLGNTASYSGNFALADGLVINMSTLGEHSGYSDGANGYASGVVVFKQADTATAGSGIEADWSTIQGNGALQGATFSADASGNITADGMTTGSYYINSGTVYYGGPNAPEDIKTAHDLVLQPTASATLVMAANFEPDCVGGIIVKENAVGARLRINAEQADGTPIVILASNVHANAGLVLEGNGTYSINSASLGTNVSLDANAWAGTVRLSGFSASGQNLATAFTKNGSWVEMNGITGGYLDGWNNGDETANIILTNPDDNTAAWKWTDGSSSSETNITFTGKWKGDGTFLKETTDKRQGFTFTGDISEWTGDFRANSGAVTKLEFAGSATAVNIGKISNESSGALNIVVSNNATIASDISKEGSGVVNLTVAAGKHATFKGTTDINGASSIGGTIYNTGTMTLAGTVTVNAGNISAFEVYDSGSSGSIYSGTGAYAGSGFLVNDSAQYYIVKSTGSGTLTYNDVSIAGSGYTKVDGVSNALVVSGAADQTNYYVNTDMYTASHATLSDPDMLSKATGVTIAKNATLTAWSARNSFTNAAKLHGEGTYELARNVAVLNTNLSIGSDWTGTVRIVETTADNVNFANLANGTLSTIELKGFSGYTTTWYQGAGVHTQNLKLTNGSNGYAWRSTGATSGTGNTAIFSGTWSGDGVFQTQSNLLNFRYEGDISAWTGTFHVNSGSPTLTFAKQATEVNATIERAAGTLNVVAETDVMFNKNITATGFTNAANTVTLGNDVTLTIFKTSADAVSDFGNVNVAKNATIVDTNFNGVMNFSSITGGGDSTLTLLSSHSAAKSVWNLGVAGQSQVTPFGGKLVLMAERDGNANRAADFNFVDGFMFSGAEVQIKNGTDSGVVLTNTLQLKAASVTIGGLSDAAAGTVAGDRIWSVTNGSGQSSATLALNGHGTYATDIKLADGVNLAMSGAGSQAFTGDLSAMNGAVTATAGTLTLDNSNASAGNLASATVNGGTLVLDNMNVSGAVTLSSGTLDLRSGISTGAFALNGGTLKFADADSLSVTGAFNIGGSSVLDLSRITASGPSNITLASTTAGVTGNLKDITLQGFSPLTGYDTALKTIGNDLVLTFTPQYDGLIWNKTDGNWSNATESDKNWHTAADPDTSVAFVSGKNVRFDSLANGYTVTLTDNISAGNITIDEGVVVTIKDNNNKTLTGTLKGSGTYALAPKDKTLPGVTLHATDWTGSVEVSGRMDGPTTFAGLSNANSNVKMSGASFWFSPGTMAANVLLNGDCKDNGQADPSNTAAMQINGANNSSTYNFSGSFSGAGDFAYTQTDARTATFKFQGDISRWTGDIVNYNAGNAVTYQIDRAGDVSFNGGLVQRATGGTMDVKLGNQGNSTATVGGEVAVHGATMRFRLNDGSAKVVNLEHVSLDNGASILGDYKSYNDDSKLNLADVTLKGSTATIGVSSDGHGGEVNIGSVTGNGTLSLVSDGNSSALSLISLGTADDPQTPTFSGTIAARFTNAGNDRAMVTVLKGEYTAASSVVEFGISGTNPRRAFGFGIAADTTRVLGMNDMAVSGGTTAGALNNNALFSGDGSKLAKVQPASSTTYLDNASDDTARTLYISGGDTYSTSIRVLNNVNMTMAGTGSQTFNGNLGAMNGAVSASAGKLVLANSASSAGSLASVAVTGGELDLSNMNVTGAVTLTGGMLDLASAATIGSLEMTSGSLSLGGENWLTGTGSISLAGGTLDLTRLALTEGTKQYALASTTGTLTLGTGVDFTLSDESQKDKYSLTTEGNTLYLTYNPVEDLIWRFNTGTWGAKDEWFNEAGEMVTFADKDNVTIDAAFDHVTIAMNAPAEAGEIVVMHNASAPGDTTTATINRHEDTHTLSAKSLQLLEGTSLVTNTRMEVSDEVYMAAGTEWTLNSPVDATLTASIMSESDNSRIIKQGEATLLLAGNNAMYQGGIVVEQGTLVAGSSLALGSDVAEMGGAKVTVKTGAGLTLDPGAAAAASGISLLAEGGESIYADSLTLDAGSTLTFTGNTDLVLYGGLTLGGTVNFDLTKYGFIDGEAGTPLTVTLITTGSGVTGDDFLASANILRPSNVETARLEQDGNNVLLTFTWAEIRTLYWQGGLGDWSTDKTVETWHPGQNNPNKTHFNTGDSVVFDTRTATSSVSVLDESITAGNITVEQGTHVVFQSRDNSPATTVEATTVTLDGSLTTHVALDATKVVLGDKGVLNMATDVVDRTLGAAVSGAGTLAKSEDGTLTLSGDNSAFTGTLDIRQGTVVAGSANALGNGSTINMADGTTLDGTANISGKTTISTKDDATAIVSAVLAVNGEDKLTFGGNGKITVSGSISGTGEVDKVGFGTTVLKNMESFTGTLHASQGTLQLESTLGDWDSGRGIAKFETESGSTIVLQGEKAITASELNWVAGTTFDLSKLNFTGERINLVELKPEDGKELRETFIVPYSQVTNWVGGAENTDRYTIQGMVLTGLNSYKGVKPVRLRFSAQSTVLYVYVEESSLDAKYWQGTSGDTWNNKTSNQWSGSEAGPGDSAWAFNAQNPNSAYFMDKGGDKTQVVKVQGLELSRESGGGIGWDHIGDMVFGKDAKYSLVRSEATQSGTTLVFESNSVIHTPVTMLVRSGAVVDIGLGLNMGNGSELQVESGATLTVKPRSQVKDESGETSLVSRGEKLNLFSVANQGTTTLDAGEVYAKFLTNYATMTIVSHDEYSAYSANESTATRLGTVTNMNGAALTFSGNCIYGFDIVTEDSTEPGYVLNYGDVTYDTADTDRDALVVAVPNKGTGTIHTKGNKAVHFDSVGMTEEWHGGKYTAVMGVGTVSTHDLDMQAAETAFNQHLEVTGKAVLAAGKKAYIHSSSEIADLALKSIIGEDEDGEVVIQASSDLHYGGQAVVEYPIYAWDEETYEAFTEPVVEGYTQTTHSADEVTVEAGSTLYVDKGATVTLGSLNAAPTDAGIGHVTVGEGDELSSTLSASLEIEGVANVDTFTVVSGTATVQGAASINQIMQDGGTLTLEKNSVLNGSGSGAAKTGGTVTGGTLALENGITLDQNAVVDVRKADGATDATYTINGQGSKIDATDLELEKSTSTTLYREAVVTGGGASIATEETDYRSGFICSGDEFVKLFDVVAGATLLTTTTNTSADHYDQTVLHSSASDKMILIDSTIAGMTQQQLIDKFHITEAYFKDGSVFNPRERVGWAFLHTAALALKSYYVRDDYVGTGSAVTLHQVYEASKGEGESKSENPNLETVVFDTTNHNVGKLTSGSLTVDVERADMQMFVVEGPTSLSEYGTFATLNVDKVYGSDTQLAVVAADSTYTGVDGYLTLEGVGIYEIKDRNDLGAHVSLRDNTLQPAAPEWDGTVRVTGTSTSLSVEELSVGEGADASTIEFKHWTGALESGEHSSDAKIVLTGTAVSAADPAAMDLLGTEDIAYTFTNTVTGANGRVKHSNPEEGEAGNVALTFTGDTSGWNGIYEQNTATKDALTFTGGTEVNANVVVSQGDMALTYGGTVTTVNSDVTVYKGGEGATNTVVNYTGGEMTVAGLLYSDGHSGLTLNVGPKDGETDTVATFTGSFVGTRSSVMNVRENSTAKIETDAELLRVYGSAGSNVTVGTGKTLKLSSTDAENSYSEFHQLTNAGTIDMKADGGSIHLVVDEDVQNPSYRVGALELTDAAGEAAIETATHGKTVQVDITSLSGPKDAGQVLALENQDGTGTVNYNLGGDTHFTGTIQFGADSAVSKDATGVTNVVLKSDDVAANAVLKSTGTQAGTANVVVDTANASVKGITSDDNPAGTVYGTDGSANKKLTITGDGEYSYKGDLGANLDIAYTGDGQQTFEGNADSFNGKVTVDNGSTEEGVLKLLDAASMKITDLTIGANNTLDVQKGSADGNVTVSGTLLAKGTETRTVDGSQTGNASRMDANLTLASSSTLNVAAAGGTGGLDLGGSLTIASGAMLSQADMATVWNMGVGDMYDLAFNVTGLTVGSGVDWNEEVGGWDAAQVFGNGMKEGEFYIRHVDNGGNGKNVGQVFLYRLQTPEPTTGTLSLLALAALCARRRRKA